MSDAASIKVTVNPQSNGSALVVAKFLDAGGKPVTNRPADFFILAKFFGEHPVRIGTATTDTSGSGTVPYQPSWDGQHVFQARLANDTGTPAIGEATADLKSVMPKYHSEPTALPGVRASVGVGAGALTLSVWGILLWTLGRTVAVIRRQGREEREGPGAGPVLKHG